MPPHINTSCMDTLISTFSKNISNSDVPDMDLSGVVAIVTGANTGIGKETARGLAERGAQVILACRSVARGEVAAKDIRGKVRVKECDLASFKSVREFCRQVIKEERKVDILINNAGWSP